MVEVKQANSQKQISSGTPKNPYVQETGNVKASNTNVQQTTPKIPIQQMAQSTQKISNQISQISQPMASQNESAEKEEKSKKMSGGLWAIIILAIIVACGLIYYFFFM